MSLHKFADMVAKQGRGEDSLLIHMTPDEVQRLQKFAEANGRSLTINPETGLPEAGMLSDLFKAVAPIALGAFLGPAGAAFGGGLMSAGMAGLTVGGITTLATGSLSRGLMAGLGAYGGAGLGESLMGAGTGALEAGAASAAQGQLGAAQLALGEALPEQAAAQFTKDAAARQLASATPWDKMGAGLSSITSSPSAAGAFAKDNWKSLAAAASPIMAGAMVPTTTKMPENNSPAYIRQKLYDPYTQTYKTLAPVKASEWGNRSFSDAYTNPQTGEMATLQPRAPSGMAAGGIVALAIGGEAKSALEDAYAKNDVDAINRIVSENKITAEDVGSTWKGFDTSGIAGLNLYTPPAADTADAGGGGAPAYTQYSDQDFANYLTTHKDADFAKDLVTYNADPAAFNKYLASTAGGFKGSTDTTGGSGTLGIYNQWNAMGVSPDEYYAAAIANDPKYAGWTKEDITRGFNLDKGAYALSAAEKDGVSDKEWANFMDTNKYSVNDMAQAFGLSRNEVQRRYDAAKKEEKKLTGTTTSTTTTPTRVTDTVLPTNPTVNAPPNTRNPYGNVNNPGDLTFNNDGSITVQPNIPGRPYGGFSGMDEVKNAYTAGGGSLGYIPKAPKTIDEFNQMFNRQTGDSMAAYEYLMGKAGAKYPVQSTAASGAQGIMRPYWSAGMKYKPKFLSYDKDGTIKSSETSGNAPSAGASGDLTKAQTIEIVDSSGEATQTYTAVLQKDGTYLAGNGKRYDVTGKELAAGGGIMGYASGGITGNGNLNLNIPLDIGGYGGGGGNGMPVGSIGVTGSTGGTGAVGSANPNVSVGGYGYADRPDETGGLYKGPMTMPGGLYDGGMANPGVLAANAANQQRNAAAQTQTAANPASLSSLAKTLGVGTFANGGMTGYAMGGGLGSLGGYSDGGRLLKGPGDGVSDSIPATIGAKQQPARLADGEFVIPARIVSELGNGSTEAGAKKLYAMMDRVQKARGKTTGKNKVAANSRADKHLPA